MKIVGIVGSPRKNGRTSALVQAAVEGARRAGAEVELVYLVDFAIRRFTGVGGSDEAFDNCAEELSTLCAQANGLIMGAPVYWGDINGLTKDWMDTVRLLRTGDKAGLGIAVAGGSGKGLLSGVQSIYHWFYHKQMRCVEPMPVTRFNMEHALAQLVTRGAELAALVREMRPFAGATVESRWEECTAYYADVPYLRADPVDEFLLLAGQLVAQRGAQSPEAGRLLAQARAALDLQDRAEAARLAVRCYQLLGGES